MARRLRASVRQRLAAAVEDIFGMFETTLVEYESEIEGLHKLLGGSVKIDEQENSSGLSKSLRVGRCVMSL